MSRPNCARNPSFITASETAASARRCWERSQSGQRSLTSSRPLAPRGRFRASQPGSGSRLKLRLARARSRFAAEPSATTAASSRVGATVTVTTSSVVGRERAEYQGFAATAAPPSVPLAFSRAPLSGTTMVTTDIAASTPKRGIQREKVEPRRGLASSSAIRRARRESAMGATGAARCGSTTPPQPSSVTHGAKPGASDQRQGMVERNPVPKNVSATVAHPRRLDHPRATSSPNLQTNRSHPIANLPRTIRSPIVATLHRVADLADELLDDVLEEDHPEQPIGPVADLREMRTRPLRRRHGVLDLVLRADASEGSHPPVRNGFVTFRRPRVQHVLDVQVADHRVGRIGDHDATEAG